MAFRGNREATSPKPGDAASFHYTTAPNPTHNSPHYTSADSVVRSQASPSLLVSEPRSFDTPISPEHGSPPAKRKPGKAPYDWDSLKIHNVKGKLLRLFRESSVTLDNIEGTLHEIKGPCKQTTRNLFVRFTGSKPHDRRLKGTNSRKRRDNGHKEAAKRCAEDERVNTPRVSASASVDVDDYLEPSAYQESDAESTPDKGAEFLVLLSKTARVSWSLLDHIWNRMSGVSGTSARRSFHDPEAANPEPRQTKHQRTEATQLVTGVQASLTKLCAAFDIVGPLEFDETELANMICERIDQRVHADPAACQAVSFYQTYNAYHAAQTPGYSDTKRDQLCEDAAIAVRNAERHAISSWDKNSITLLHLAAALCLESICGILLWYGADPHAEAMGYTPAEFTRLAFRRAVEDGDLARAHCLKRIMQLLIYNIATPNARPRKKLNPRADPQCNDTDFRSLCNEFDPDPIRSRLRQDVHFCRDPLCPFQSLHVRLHFPDLAKAKEGALQAVQTKAQQTPKASFKAKVQTEFEELKSQRYRLHPQPPNVPAATGQASSSVAEPWPATSQHPQPLSDTWGPPHSAYPFPFAGVDDNLSQPSSHTAWNSNSNMSNIPQSSSISEQTPSYPNYIASSTADTPTASRTAQNSQFDTGLVQEPCDRGPGGVQPSSISLQFANQAYSLPDFEFPARAMARTDPGADSPSGLWDQTESQLLPDDMAASNEYLPMPDNDGLLHHEFERGISADGTSVSPGNHWQTQSALQESQQDTLENPGCTSDPSPSNTTDNPRTPTVEALLPHVDLLPLWEVDPASSQGSNVPPDDGLENVMFSRKSLGDGAMLATGLNKTGAEEWTYVNLPWLKPGGTDPNYTALDLRAATDNAVLSHGSITNIEATHTPQMPAYGGYGPPMELQEAAPIGSRDDLAQISYIGADHHLLNTRHSPNDARPTTSQSTAAKRKRYALYGREGIPQLSSGFVSEKAAFFEALAEPDPHPESDEAATSSKKPRRLGAGSARS